MSRQCNSDIMGEDRTGQAAAVTEGRSEVDCAKTEMLRMLLGAPHQIFIRGDLNPLFGLREREEEKRRKGC